MRSAFPPALVPFHANETVENRTKNRKPNNYLGYLSEIGWRLSAAFCITPEVTLIWFPKKVSEMKPGELMKISRTPM